jgi:GDPmannose 4,6-dehydratase
MKTAIVFGIGGQDGHYLSELLSKRGIKVIGVDRSSNKWLMGDIADSGFVEALVKKHKPEYIFHLAAISSTKHNFIFANHQAISIGTLNILENVKNYCLKCRVFLSGSALQFKNTGKPINEKTPFEAKSAYAVERIYSTYLARYYRDTFGVKVYIGYFFNHDSPLRTADHISRKIVNSVNLIKEGSKEKLRIGDLKAKKEFNFAGDIMEAVWLLVNQGKIYEVVIGSGRAYSIKDWVQYCFNKIHKDWKKYVIEDRDFVRDYKVLVSNPALIKSLGWKPKVNFHQLADMMMDQKL